MKETSGSEGNKTLEYGHRGNTFGTSLITPAKDYNSLGLIFTEHTFELNTRSVFNGETFTYQALLKKAKQLGADAIKELRSNSNAKKMWAECGVRMERSVNSFVKCCFPKLFFILLFSLTIYSGMQVKRKKLSIQPALFAIGRTTNLVPMSIAPIYLLPVTPL